MDFVKKIFNIWKYVIFNPKGFFDEMPKGPWYSTPLIFAVLMSWIGLILHLVVRSIRGNPYMIAGAASIVLAPVAVYVAAFVTHFFVSLFKGRGNFDTTFKIVAYANAAAIFNSIPLISFVASIWGMVIVFIGIKKLHGLDTAKTVWVLILPGLIIFLGLIVVGALLRLGRGI